VVAALQLVAAFAVGWAASEIALRRIFKDGLPDAIGGPERALLCVGGIVAFGVALMAGHLITGGAVFGNPMVVPIAGAATLAVAVRRARLPRVPWAALLGVAALLVALYVLPVILGGSSVRTGDSPWHLGWTNELLAGEPIPTGPAPEFGRNAYPWGLHSYLATIVRLVPGSDALAALESLHLLLVISIPLAAASLGRLLDRRAGWAAAAAATLVGGFGWITAWGAAFATSPRGARTADLTVASPNAVYQMFPPGLPRELGLALLAAAAVLLALGISDRRARIPAGIALGLVGLLSVPMFVNGVVWFIAVFAIAGRGVRKELLARVALPALAILSLWAGPVVSYAIRYGGFVNITPRLGREWPLPVALFSWGILLPLALAGLFLAFRRASSASFRFVLALSSGTTLLLLLSKARGWFDWGLAGNATLLHQGRVWPAVHLLGAALAGLGAVSLWRWMRARSWPGALVAAAVALALGVASPTLAAARMTHVLEFNLGGFEYDDANLNADRFIRRAADLMGPDDVIEVQGPQELGWLLWQFSGARLAFYDHPLLETNDLRIRYVELADAYAKKIDAGGFQPTFIVVPAEEASGRALTVGEYDGQDWALVDGSR
jgi:hypothetical protein